MFFTNKKIERYLAEWGHLTIFLGKDVPEIITEMLEKTFDNTGRMSYASEIKKNFTIVEARPDRIVHYNIYGAYPTSISFQNDSTVSDTKEVVFSVDYCQTFIEE